MTARHTALAILIALCLVGCPKQKPVAKPAAPLGSSEQVASAASVASSAQHDSDAAEATRLSKIAADSDAATKAVEEDRKADAAGALGVQQAHLADVPRDADEARRLAEAEQLRAEGRAAEAEKSLEELREDAKADAIKIEDLRRERDRLAAERDQLTKDLIAQAERNRAENQKAIDEALKRAAEAEKARKDAIRKSQATKLTTMGIGALAASVVVLGAAWFFGGGLLGLRKVAPVSGLLGVAGAFFLGAAQIIGHPYFLPAVGTGILFFVIWVGCWLWKHQNRGDLAEELQRRTSKLATVAKVTVPILDKAYDEGSTAVHELVAKMAGKGAEEKVTVRDLLDHLIFNPLSNTMDKPTKATVHEIRATT